MNDANIFTQKVLKQPRWMTIVGWLITIPPVAMFVGGGLYAAINPKMMLGGFEELGWPADVAPYIVATEILCGLVFLFPKTSILGAILLTGYLGGAMATHIRVHDPKAAVAAIFGIVVWLAIFLREPRLRQILFWR
jgi:hypothetical protein